MDGLPAAALTAIWLGILTAISPCPLATNIAAVSYIGKNAAQTRRVFFSGALYLLGRMTACIVLAVVIVASLLTIPAISNFLQHYMNKALGPVLIIAGMFLLELIRLPAAGGPDTTKLHALAEKNIYVASFTMGLLFALAFCPVSAALFFGSLIPLSVRNHSPIIMPALYGAGTALPVLVFALLAAFGGRYLSNVFNTVTSLEIWARRITGFLFILAGIYFCIVYIFEIQFL